MNRFVFFFSAFILFFTYRLDAQCPLVLNCFAPTDTICDFSENDSLLWAGPSWWDPLNEMHDLAEVPTDLQLSIVDTCGGISIRCLLFLDLDGDGSLESVLNSDSLPPPATIFYNNAGNAGYSGGTPLVFDARPVTSADKYRFVLRQTFVGDTILADIRWTTDSTPAIFVVPELPAGKHKIVWLIEKAGVTDTCTHHFVVRDCKPPAITCKTGLSINIFPAGLITLWALDFLQNATDNITPENLLQYAIRKAGDGNGFPLDNQGKPITSVTFDCCDLGPQLVELWVRDKAGNVSFCTADIDIQDAWSNCGGCYESLQACAKTFWDSTKIHDVIFYLKVLPTIDLFANSLTTGCGDFYSILFYGSSYRLVSEKDDNPLNGVSTFDLVLISKHILGLEPLDAPWKMLAADANGSNSITTFDIVELRKLILGIYSELPDNSSWRFVPGDFVFPDPDDPFATLVPDTIVVNNFSGFSTAEHSFYGYKVGDVNNSSVSADFAPVSDDRATALLTLPDITFVKGETIEITLQAGEAGKWNGFQFELLFDPKLIEIERVIPDALPGLDENAWAWPRPGCLSMSWFDANSHTVLPGENLLRLHIRALDSGRLSEVVSLATERLRPEVYEAGHSIRNLQLRFSESIVSNGPTAIFPPQPNPTTSGTSFPIRIVQPDKAALEIMDVTGKRIYHREELFVPGNQLFEVPASAFSVTGIYVWRLKIGSEVQSGKIVRQ